MSKKDRKLLKQSFTLPFLICLKLVLTSFVLFVPDIDEEEEAKYYQDLIVLSDDEDNQKEDDFETYRNKLLSNL